MDAMDMMGMGMDMGSETQFEGVNSDIARSYWYIIAGIVGFTLVLRVINFIETRIRLRLATTRSVQYPTQPRNWFMQVIATGSTILREVAAPEYHIKNSWLSWLSPPPLGRSLMILIYWAVIIYMLCWNSIVNDAYYFERIAFRAAWISVTQVPFVYLLASKSSILGLLSGSSYERLNWLHRWVSRTLLVTVTIHGGFFYAEWYRADFVQLELSVMPMVKYGMGAWGILLWTFLSSLTPIRRFSYELFVLQHLAAASVFLWLLWVHVPAYAQYNIWFAIAAVSFDKLLIYSWTAYTNLTLRRKSRSGKRIGHNTSIRAINDATSEVIIHDIPFSWSAGQHIYLRLPTMGPLEAHPFTIANHYSKSSGQCGRDLQLIVESKSGFTRRLHRHASRTKKRDLTAIVTGPFGRPPNWASYETLILISASTGASFTLPVLESAVYNSGPNCISRIDVLMVVRRQSHVESYIPRLQAALKAASLCGIDLNIRIAVTCEPCGCCGPNCNCCNGSPVIYKQDQTQIGLEFISSGDTTEKISSDDDSESISSDVEKGNTVKMTIERQSSREEFKSLMSHRIKYTKGRPDIAEFIRRPVETTGGETSVAVCGGKSIVSCVRNRVAALSDERGVHKGTGAQGIHLHTEHYCI